jgi:hypothetical protein
VTQFDGRTPPKSSSLPASVVDQLLVKLDLDAFKAKAELDLDGILAYQRASVRSAANRPPPLPKSRARVADVAVVSFVSRSIPLPFLFLQGQLHRRCHDLPPRERPDRGQDHP